MDDHTMWAAVLDRNASLDGRLYYGVRSTRIVCRTTCPSRRPRREQVVFFERLDAAIEGGFRPCRRCHPERPVSELRHYAEVQRACDLLHRDPTLRPSTVARCVGLTLRQLQRAFEWWLGTSPREYRAACRLSRFKAATTRTNDTTSAGLDAGYPSIAGLYEHAGALGMTPGAYRAAAPGIEVRYAATSTDLGEAILAATDAGVCSLRLGDARSDLLEELHQEFAKATLIEDGAGLAPWLRLVEAYLAGRARTLAVPLDVHGTLFQLRVWSALLAIPPGESRT